MRTFGHKSGKWTRCFYAAAFLVVLLANVGTRGLSHAHSHDMTSVVTIAIHSSSHHDEDCNPVVDCDEPHDTNTSNFHFESSHCALVQVDLVSATADVPMSEVIESDDASHENWFATAPLPPPKHA